MWDWYRLRDSAFRQGLKLMSDPRVIKLMSNPTVMKVMMQALELRSTVEGTLDERGRALARRFQLVTREDVSHLVERLRELEDTLQSVLDKEPPAGEHPADSEGNTAGNK
jgi:hypothetical protein